MKKKLLGLGLLMLVCSQGISQWGHKFYIGLDYGIGIGLSDFSDKDYTKETSASATGGSFYGGLIAGYDLEAVDNLGVAALVRFSRLGLSESVLTNNVNTTFPGNYYLEFDEGSSYKINQFLVGADYTISFWNDILAWENKAMVGLMSATRPAMTFTEESGNGTIMVDQSSKIVPSFLLRTGLRWKLPYINLPLGFVSISFDTDRVFIGANVSYTAAKLKFDVESDQANSPINGKTNHNLGLVNFGLTISVGLIEN